MQYNNEKFSKSPKNMDEESNWIVKFPPKIIQQHR